MPLTSQPPRPTDAPQNAIFRDARLEVSEGDAPAVRATVSSDTALPDVLFMDGNFRDVFLSLSHAPEAIDRTYCADGLPIRDGHYGDQIGLIRQLDADGSRMGGQIEWCSGQRAKEIAADCTAKLRRAVSVEALLDMARLERIGDQDGMPVIRCNHWFPTAAAVTSNAPADPRVGVFREKSATVTITPAPTPQPQVERNQAMPEETTTAAVNHAQIERDRVTSILTLGQNKGVPVERTKQAVANGESLDAFKDFLLDFTPAPAPVARDGSQPTLDAKDISKYSIIRAIRCQMPDSRDGKCLEREISDTLAKTSNKPPCGILIPSQVLARDLTVGGTGGNLVATDLLASDFIDILANKTCAQKLGVTMMGGLRGNVAIPKHTAASTGYWLAEGGAPTESQQTLGQIIGNPHTAGAWTDISRLMLAQSSLSAQALVSRDIVRVISLLVDLACIQGTGVDGQPKGVIYADGVNDPTVTTGTPTYAEVLGFISMIMADNADLGDMAWLMPPAVWAKLAATSMDTGSGTFVLNPSTKEMAGIRYVVSNQAVAKSLALGVWSELVLAMWGALDLTVDTSALQTSGGVRVVGLQDVDVMVRNGQAFAYDGAVIS